MQESILVVGGAGYIGSHTAKLLEKRGYRPVILDDLSTGHQPAARSLPFYQGSYHDTSLLKTILTDHKINTVMHFGAKAIVGESVANPLLYYSANAGGTLRLFEAMIDAGAGHFIFSSTCATFGEPKEVPIHENVTQSPVNPYGQSKLFVEKILKDIHKAHKINSVILRYFNAAGADPDGELGEDHKPETHLIPKAIQVALGREKKLTVNGKDYPTKDGTCIRDYVHINDLADAHIRAMEYLWKNPSCSDFNLGSEKGFSVLEVIEAVSKTAGKPVAHEFGPRRPGDPPVLIADSKKAKQVLGWAPKFSLEEIVATAYRWTKEHPDGYDI
ncbi:MAG: UDP-glucose 4-epimerase GalE [Bdellovibrionota bacterium]